MNLWPEKLPNMMHMSLRRYINRLSFSAKINLGVTVILVASALMSIMLVSLIASRSLTDAAKQRGESLSQSLAVRSVEPLLAVDFLRLKNLVDQTVKTTSDAVYAFVQDESGNVLAHTFQGGFPTQLKTANMLRAQQSRNTRLLDASNVLIYDFAAIISLGGPRLGTVHIGLSRSQIDAKSTELAMAVATAVAIVGALSILISSFFSSTITRRLALLRESAEEVVKGNLDIQTGPRLEFNCWELNKCDIDHCPAYGDERRRCWHMAGTMCPECQTRDSYPDKIESCRSCNIYRTNVGDEIQELAEAFDVMAITLKSHISELNETQQKLARQKELLRTIFDVTPDLVSLQAADLSYQAVNQAFCRYFNLNEENILGKTDFEIFSIQQAEVNQGEDEDILATGIPISKEIMVSRQNARRWFHIVKVPVYEKGETLGLLMTARDISVIKNYQEQLIQSQKMEDLGRLAGGVAHEINTPLGIILGYAQMLLEDLKPESQEHQDIQIIERQTQVCRKIVADLLGFSRQSSSTMNSMDLNASIEGVVNLVRTIFRNDRVEIETHLDSRIPPIQGDDEKLRSVWINLVNNAFDAIGQDGTIAIRTKLCKHRRRVVVLVADTGSGISHDNLKRVFDPFFTTKGVGKGTGLGLSISFGVIKDHKGRISAVSPAPVQYQGEVKSPDKTPGPGTLFVIELPLGEDGLPDEECEDVSHLVGAVRM